MGLLRRILANGIFLLGISSEFLRDSFGMRAKKYYFCGIVKNSKKSLRL